MGDAGAIMGTLPSNSTMMNIVRIGLGITLIGMAFIGLKAHTKDPGV